MGSKAVEAIVEAREGGGAVPEPRRLLRARLACGVVSQACVETLIKAGAFDALGGAAEPVLAVLPRAAQAGQAMQEDRSAASAASSTTFDDARRQRNGNGNGNGNGDSRPAA